jgi:hypothetical protein
MKKSNGVYFPEEVMLFLCYIAFVVKKKKKKKKTVLSFIFILEVKYLWIMTNGYADKTLLRNSANGSHNFYSQLNIYMQISFYIAI